MDVNERISAVFDEIAEYYDFEKDRIRKNTYEKASLAIMSYEQPIISGKQVVKDVYGIGKKIGLDIDEFLKTGKIQRLETLRSLYGDKIHILKLFTSIHGIGSATAMKFYNAGYRTIEDLLQSGKLNETQKKSIFYSYHVHQRIPHDIIQKFHLYCLEKLSMISFDIAGSYRRGESFSSDIDLIFIHSTHDMKDVIDLLKDIIIDTLSQGEHKMMGFVTFEKLLYRIDIRMFEKENYVFALMRLTGSKKFNQLMSSRALELGLSLSEYGLIDTFKNDKKSISCTTEQEIFDSLRVMYISPTQRSKTLSKLITY